MKKPRKTPKKAASPPKAPQTESISLAKLQRENRAGLRCPKCNCGDWRTERTEKANGHVRRVRVCRYCGHRMTTRET